MLYNQCLNCYSGAIQLSLSFMETVNYCCRHSAAHNTSIYQYSVVFDTIAQYYFNTSAHFVLQRHWWCYIWNLQRYLPAHHWASHTPSVVDFEVVPVLCTAIIIACYFLAPLTRVGGSSIASWVTWLTLMMTMIPIDGGVLVASLQVRTSLWFVVTVAMSGIIVNVLAFQFEIKIILIRT